MDYNILGAASCVPALAHAIFGFGGLFSHVLVLCHAVYSIGRQVNDGCFVCVGFGESEDVMSEI